MIVQQINTINIDDKNIFTAKNVALAGVRKLTLHDTKTCTWLDLSTQYYLSESNIGENRY